MLSGLALEFLDLVDLRMGRQSKLCNIERVERAIPLTVPVRAAVECVLYQYNSVRGES